MESRKSIVFQNLIIHKIQLKRLIGKLKLIVFYLEDVLDKCQILPAMVQHALDVFLAIENY